MAGGHGPAPKPKEQRRNRASPQRGEWVDLPAVFDSPVPVDPPKRVRGTGEWHPRTERAWSMWRVDPATTQWVRRS